MSRLPTTFDDNTPLVFLTHEYTEGAREDATLTVGVGSGGIVGYDRITDGQGTFGSVNKTSPLTGLHGLGKAGKYSFSIGTLFSFSREFLEGLSRIRINGVEYSLGGTVVHGGEYRRRIVNGPRGWAAATLTLNFRRTDNSYYFTDASTSIRRAGLWQHTNDTWHRVVSNRQVHDTGPDIPRGVPGEAGVIYSNALGQFWVSATQYVSIVTAAAGTDQAFSNPWYVRDPVSFVVLWNTVVSSVAQYNLTTGRGGFYWPFNGNTHFTQFLSSQADRTTTQLWNAAWAYIRTSVVEPNQAAIGGGYATLHATLVSLEASVFLGRFTSLRDALEAMSNRAITTTDFAARDYYYGLGQIDHGVRKVTTYTPAIHDREAGLHWVGPFIKESDVHDRLLPDPATMADGLIAFVSGNRWITGRAGHPHHRNSIRCAN